MERWLARTEVMQRPSESGLEQDLIQLVTRAGLPEPVRQHPLRLLNGDLIHIDMAWPDVRFGLEPGHTWWHGGDLKMRSDQARIAPVRRSGGTSNISTRSPSAAPDIAAQIARLYTQRRRLVVGG